MTDTETPSEKQPQSSLEQFVLLAKTTKGAAATELVKQVIDASDIHVFGELLDMPNIKDLQNSPSDTYWKTLELFAYGTYKQYLENQNDFLELTAKQTKKLRHLTIVTLATKSRFIPYPVLLEELNVSNVRELEDLIIEAIYADVIHGKLDQKNSLLEVIYTGLGRDVRPNDTLAVLKTLSDWSDSCSITSRCIEEQVTIANERKQKANQHNEEIQKTIAELKKKVDIKTDQEQNNIPMHDRKRTIAQFEDRHKIRLNKKSYRKQF